MRLFPKHAKWIVSLWMLIQLMAGCSMEKTSIELGFIGGISGGNADLGQAGRNGAMLVVAEANRTGGINGRTVELVITDDANSVKTAKAAARDLVKKKVEAIIGPFTSTLSEAVQPITEPEKMLLFSPTATAIQFAGKDDYFFRLNATTSDNAEAYTRFIAVRRKLARISMVVDQRNHTFEKSRTDAFKREVCSLGCEVVLEKWYNSKTCVYFESLIKQLVEPKPGAVLIVANAVDVARIAHQFRKEDKTTKMIAVEWAGTRQLNELGGKAVDGVEVMQVFNMFGKQEKYLRFVEAYRDRFKSLPSFPSITDYETTQILIAALKNRKDGQSLKQSILANAPYQGLQHTLLIDSYGDCPRKSYFVIVRGDEFAPTPQ